MQEHRGKVIFHCRTSSKVIDVLNEYAPLCYSITPNGAVLIEQSLFDEVEAWKEHNVPISKIIKELHLSKRQKQEVLEELKNNDALSMEWYSELLDDIFIRSECMDCLSSIVKKYKVPPKEKFISKEVAKRKYGVPNANMTYAIAAGRLKEYNGKLMESEVEKLLVYDSRLITLSSVLSQIEIKYQTKITTKLRELIIEEIVKNRNWNAPFLLGETVLVKEADKKDIYFEEGKVPLCRITESIVRYSDMLSSTWQPFLWEKIPQKTRTLISSCYNVLPGEIVANPKLQHILSASAKIGKEIDSWHEGDLTMLAREGINEACQNEVAKFIRYAKGRGVQVRCDTKEVIEFVRRNEKKYKDDAYTFEQFLELSSLVFDSLDPNVSSNIKRAIEDEEIAQVLLFLAMHYAVAWRKSDITMIGISQVDDITVLIDNLRKGSADIAKLVEVWMILEQTWDIKHTASKNKGDLVFWAPEDYYAMLGAYLTICEYHRISKKSDVLMDKKLITNKKSCYLRAIGQENHKAIFGKNNFSSKRMNKVVLMQFVKRTNENYKEVMVRSLGEIVAAHLRGHKIDLADGQKTILHYISSRSEGLTIDEISYELFIAGTVGYYKHFIAEKVLPEYNRMRFKEQNAVVTCLEVDPMEVERKVEEFELMCRNVNEITNSFPGSFSQFAYELGERLHAGFGMANEKNVICVYSLVVGDRPDTCKAQRYCSACQDTNYNGLCKYGLYAKQYVKNLYERIESLSRINSYIIENIQNRVDQEAAYGTFNRNVEVVRFLQNLILQFVSSKEIPAEIERAVKTQILEESQNAIKKL